MATVTFEDVPDTFVKKYWRIVSFRSFQVAPKKTFREQMEDPTNISHGPYSSDEFIAIQKSWR